MQQKGTGMIGKGICTKASFRSQAMTGDVRKELYVTVWCRCFKIAWGFEFKFQNSPAVLNPRCITADALCCKYALLCCRGKGVAKNIASALAFLHKKKVVHLDVKSANILLTSNNVAKLGCDFQAPLLYPLSSASGLWHCWSQIHFLYLVTTIGKRLYAVPLSTAWRGARYCSTSLTLPEEQIITIYG